MTLIFERKKTEMSEAKLKEIYPKSELTFISRGFFQLPVVSVPEIGLAAEGASPTEAWKNAYDYVVKYLVLDRFPNAYFSQNPRIGCIISNEDIIGIGSTEPYAWEDAYVYIYNAGVNYVEQTDLYNFPY
jgi:hypothetical protein